MSTKESRDKRLDDLGTAISAWATSQREQLNEQVARAEALLKGRTGASRLSSAMTSGVKSLLVEEINNFLRG